MTNTEKLIQEVLDEKSPSCGDKSCPECLRIRRIMQIGLERLAEKMRSEQV